jgi:RimJ/RimL family protein N-acetyltransferase
VRTDRLILRRWQDSDREPFAAMNADPQVMEYFPAMLTRAESDTMVDRIEEHFEQYGYGLWALEVARTSEFIGFTGLSTPRFDAPFMPATEIGWRLAQPAWGHGYASEAARHAVRYGFEQAGLAEILSWTATQNVRSRAVMERLGMTRDPADDFDHPRIPEGSPLRRHVLYRLTRQRWVP